MEVKEAMVDVCGRRCGTGLMEMGFAPDLRRGEEAAALVKELVLILEKLYTR